ncbi:MAG: hypothetical protein ACYC4R_01680 [Anaerolineae bacterium]
MSYIYAIRGWLELSWPDAEVEGIDETPEEHDLKIRRAKELLIPKRTPEELLDEDTPREERYLGGWAFPTSNLDGTEYIFFGGDVEEPAVVLGHIRKVLELDPFADGYFSIEGEDGEQYRQWLILGGKILTKRYLFPDFDVEEPPAGYSELSGT